MGRLALALDSFNLGWRTLLDSHRGIDRSRLRTCYSFGMAAAFAPRDEDDITLARIDVVVFEDEELVDSVLLEDGDLDNDANGTDQASIKDDIFLAADLRLPRSD